MDHFKIKSSILTPSLPQPLKFPGWRMHGRVCAQYIFRSSSTSTFNAYDNPFAYQCGKEKKKMVKGFTFHIFVGRFQVISWQWRGYAVPPPPLTSLFYMSASLFLFCFFRTNPLLLRRPAPLSWKATALIWNFRFDLSCPLHQTHCELVGSCKKSFYS